MKYKNLIISSGSIKGFYFLGALKYLYEKNLLDIKKILGVSIGSVISYLLIIGYDINFLIDVFEKMNIQKYMPEINIDTILEEYYFFDNSKFDKIIIFFTKKKNLNLNITLLELYKKTNIEFILGSSNISKNTYEYISYKNYPDLSVLTALKMSYAIPLIFKPIIYNDQYYVDGALKNSFPIKYFKNDIKNTIGIQLLLENEQITDISSYLKNIMKSCINNKSINHYPNNSILIEDIFNISFFDLINTDKVANIRKNMINKGYEQAQIFFDNKYNFIKNIVLDIINNINE
jgi:NTE family protein